MTCGDWRDASSEELAALYAAERRRWGQALWWDLGPSLAMAEAARARGELPGLVVRDDEGAAIGWSFYLLAHGVLQIGALNATTAGAVRLMLDRIFSSPESQLAQGISCFLYPVSRSVTSALTRLRFELTTHQYLVTELRDGTDAPSPEAAGWRVRPWQDADATTAIRLLARAYAGDATARCFAPQGRLEQWAQYVGQLIHVPACGGFRDEASAVVDCAGAASPAGLVITTLVAPGTAHIAQLAVDPEHRGQGMATALVRHALDRARAMGARRATLLVAAGNLEARRVYERLGFVPTASFLYGERRPAPRRLVVARPAAATPIPDLAAAGLTAAPAPD